MYTPEVQAMPVPPRDMAPMGSEVAYAEQDARDAEANLATAPTTERQLAMPVEPTTPQQMTPQQIESYVKQNDFSEEALDNAAKQMSSLPFRNLMTIAGKPENATEGRSAVAAVAGGMVNTELVSSAARNLGVKPTALPSPDSPEGQGFWQSLKGGLTHFAGAPGTARGVANEAYFDALVRGAGVQGAAKVYVDTYQKFVDSQLKERERVASLQTFAAQKMIEQEAKKAEIRQTAGTIVSDLTSSLSGTGMTAVQIAGIAPAIEQIVMLSKDNPQAALATAQGLIASAPTETARNAMVRKLSPLIKSDETQSKAIQEMRSMGVPESVLERFKLGVQTEGDSEVIAKKRQQYNLRQMQEKIDLEVGKAEALAESVILRSTEAEKTIIKEGLQAWSSANARLAEESAKLGIPAQLLRLQDVSPDAFRLLQAKSPGAGALLGGGRPAATATATPAAPSVQPSAEAQQPSAPPAPSAPATGTAPTSLAEARAAQEARAAGQRSATTDAGNVIAMQSDLESSIRSIDKSLGLLESGKHNIGSVLSMFDIVNGPRGPVAEAIGKQFETEDSKNTKLIMDSVNKIATDGLKSLGSNPSTVDLKFWVDNKPNASTDPNLAIEWLKEAKIRIENRIKDSARIVQSGGMPRPIAPSQPSQPQSSGQNVRRYNPATGKIE